MSPSKKEALFLKLDTLVREHMENTANFVFCVAALALHCTDVPQTTDDDQDNNRANATENNFHKQATSMIQILQTLRSHLSPSEPNDDYVFLKQIWSKDMYLKLYVAVESMKHLFAMKKLVPLVNQLTNGFNGLLFNDQFVSRLPNRNVEAKLVQWDALLTELHTLTHAWSLQILALHSTLNKLPIKNSDSLQRIVALSSLPPLADIVSAS